MDAREATAPADWTAGENTFPFDPRDPVFRADPYPVYDRLRETTPVLRSRLGMFVLSRHSDCVRLLHHPQTSNDQRNSALFQAYIQATGAENPFADREPSFLFLDPPDHTRLRGLVAHAFTPRRVRDLGPRVQEIVDELLEPRIADGHMEVVEEFAYLVPVRVICELLGVPPEDNEIFKQWSRDLARGLDPDFMVPAETRRVMEKASLDLRDYFEGLIAERTRRPGEDMLSALIEAEQEGEKLTHEELLSTLGLLLIAGHETTVNLIGNAVLQLGRHPDQWRRLRDDPTLARSTVEEVLRFDPPVQVTGRIAMTEINFDDHTMTPGDDHTMTPGQQAICVIGAANRDADEFGPTAGRFDITRNPNNHVAFGAGIHFCLGAPLARIEGQIALAALAKRVASFEIPDTTPSYKENFVLRGLLTLPISLEPTS